MIPTSHLYLPSTVALAVFLLLGTVDGLFLHLWRYRLYARPASRREHLYHTIAAVTFAATLPAVFLWETGGLLLWAGVLLIGADLIVSLALAARPDAAWAFDAAWILRPLPAFATFVGWQALPGAVAIGALHLWLCRDSGVHTMEALRSRFALAFSAWRGARLGCCAART